MALFSKIFFFLTAKEKKVVETKIAFPAPYSFCEFTENLMVMSPQEWPSPMTTFLSIV